MARETETTEETEGTALSATQRRRLNRRRTATLVRHYSALTGRTVGRDEAWQMAYRDGLAVVVDADPSPGQTQAQTQALVPVTGVTTTDRAGRAPTRAKRKGGAASASGAGAGTAAGLDPSDVTAEIEVSMGLLSGNPRQTLPFNANVLGQLPWAFLPRRQYQGMDLTTLQEGEYNAQQLLDLLVDAWPELGLALWNFQRLAATTYKYEVRTPDNKAEDTVGKELLDNLLARVNKNWGGFSALVNQWIASVVLQGACAGEAVPNADISDVLDLVTVQPWTIYFQRDVDQNYVAYQWQPMLASVGANAFNQSQVFTPDAKAPAPAPNLLLGMQEMARGGFRELNEVTFGYVPLDAVTDDPYGRMPFAPVMQLVAFDAQLLKDLRQWSHVNAFGRIDVSVVAEKVEELMPPAVKNDPKKRAAWYRKYLAQIRTSYNSMNPDDTFVHWDNVAVSANDPAGQTMDIDKLVRVLERRIFRALKQLPILMGSNEGTTETWGTLQMEVYAKGIGSIQRVVASLVEKLLTVSLRIMGRTSVVQFEFDPLRATDRKSEALALSLEIKNAAALRDEGWITQDEAAIKVTGSKAVADAPGTDPLVAPLQPGPSGGPNTPPPVPPPAPGSGSSTPQEGTTEAPEKADDGKTSDTEVQDAAAKTQTPPKTAKSASEPVPDAKQASEPARTPKRGTRALGGTRLAPGYPDGPDALEPAGALSLAEMVDPDADADPDTDAHAIDLTPTTGHSGIMVAFMLDPEAASALAAALPPTLPGAEAPGDYHLSLTYNGDLEEDAVLDSEAEALRSVVQAFSREDGPLSGVVSGVGRFTPPNAPAHPVYAAVDVPGLQAFRARLVAAMTDADLPSVVRPSTHFDFTPHITLAYVPSGDPTPFTALPPVPLRFQAVTLAVGDTRESFPLYAAPESDPTPPPPDDDPGSRPPVEEDDGEDDTDTAVPSPEMDPSVAAWGTGPTLDPGPVTASTVGLGLSETEVLERAIAAMLAQALDEDESPSPTGEESPTRVGGLSRSGATGTQTAQGGTPPPVRLVQNTAKRAAIARNLATEVGAWFRDQSVPQEVLRHAVSLHSRRAVANAKQTHPVLRRAIGKIAEGYATGVPLAGDRALTGDERKALIQSLEKLLERVFPDFDALLSDILVSYLTQAWDVGGQDALESLGIQDQTFKLTNWELADGIRKTAEQDVAGIQQTTRTKVANVIATSLEAGTGIEEMQTQIAGTLNAMGETRAETIGETEVADQYWEGTNLTWAKNGVPMKVWRTGDDPDPGTGKNRQAPCIDNSYAGAIPIMDNFPSGDPCPPAHPFCVCTLEPSGDINEAALAEPWTGD